MGEENTSFQHVLEKEHNNKELNLWLQQKTNTDHPAVALQVM